MLWDKWSAEGHNVLPKWVSSWAAELGFQPQESGSRVHTPSTHSARRHVHGSSKSIICAVVGSLHWVKNLFLNKILFWNNYHSIIIFCIFNDDAFLPCIIFALETAITNYPQAQWLKATELYSLKVLEARSLKLGCQEGHTLFTGENLGEDPSLGLPASGGSRCCLAWSWISQSLPASSHGLLLQISPLFSLPSLVRPHRRQPTRLPRPWESPGGNTGVRCYFLLQCVKVKSLSRVRLLPTPWTAAHQAPPSMGFSRQEHWSGCHCLLHFIRIPVNKGLLWWLIW